MKNSKNEFIRLYDFCIEDDRKPPYPRGYIFRKHRIRTGIILLLFHILVIVLSLIFIHENNVIFILIVSFSLYGFMFRTRINFMSFYYIYRLKKFEKKKPSNIIEKFILESNYEHNDISSSQENFHRFRNHYSWLTITMVFKDKKYHNLYYFKISLSGVKLKVKYSKQYKLKIKQQTGVFKRFKDSYPTDYFKKCQSIKDFQKEILLIYLNTKDSIFNQNISSQK